MFSADGTLFSAAKHVPTHFLRATLFLCRLCCLRHLCRHILDLCRVCSLYYIVFGLFCRLRRLHRLCRLCHLCCVFPQVSRTNMFRRFVPLMLTHSRFMPFVPFVPFVPFSHLCGHILNICQRFFCRFTYQAEGCKMLQMEPISWNGASLSLGGTPQLTYDESYLNKYLELKK